MYEGDVFISDVHPQLTFKWLADTHLLKNTFCRRIAAMENSFGMFTVSLVLKKGVLPYFNHNKYVYNEADDVWSMACSAEGRLQDKNEQYTRKGIRPDHDQLPAEIQAIWPANAERWKKIKEAYETCKQLTEPCDRYEYLKVLKDTWYKYKQDMARYDDYQLTADGSSEGEGAADQTPTLTPEQEKELKNADSYISKNLPQMQQLAAAANEEDFNDEQKKALESLRQRIQQRVDVLLKCGRTLTDERREQLLQCDIKVSLETTGAEDNTETPQNNEQGQESE